MIENDTGHTYIDEARFNVSDVQKARKVINNYYSQDIKCVVQAPGLFRWVNEIEIDYYSCLVVVMKRKAIELVQSYKSNPNVVTGMLEIWPEAIPFANRERALAHIPYTYWKEKTMPKIRHWDTVVYSDDLVDHPMWVPREEREGWNARQYAK
jgi:hypothetical protein